MPPIVTHIVYDFGYIIVTNCLNYFFRKLGYSDIYKFIPL